MRVLQKRGKELCKKKRTTAQDTEPGCNCVEHLQVSLSTHLSRRKAATVSAATSAQVSSGTSVKSLSGTVWMTKSLNTPSSLLRTEEGQQTVDQKDRKESTQSSETKWSGQRELTVQHKIENRYVSTGSMGWIWLHTLNNIQSY